MFRSLLSHNWKERTRSAFWQKSLIINIIIGFFGLYMVVNFLALGFVFDNILEESFPDLVVLDAFGKVFIYYLLFDLFMRFFLQEFPAMTIQPYLRFPIKKNTLFHFLLTKSIPTFFNILPYFILLPFLFKVVLPTYSIVGALAWLLGITGMILFNNYLAFLLKKYFSVKPILSLLILAILSIVAYLDWTGVYSLSETIGHFFGETLTNPVYTIIPLGLFGLMYFVLFRIFKQQAYLEDFAIAKKSAKFAGSNLSFLDRFGKIGEFIQLEVKMILRNKRPKTYLIMSICFILYPLIFIGNPMMASRAFMIFLGIFITGAFMMNHAQLLFSWESSYFDFILTKNITVKKFIESKYYILAASCLVLFCFSIPYVFLDSRMIFINLAAVLYNIGVNLILYMYFATHNTKRIEIAKKGGMFNMEGFGASHFLIAIPVIGVPTLIYLLFKLIGIPYWGIAVIGIIGLVGIIFRDRLMDLLVKKFETRKHIMASGFRKK